MENKVLATVEGVEITQDQVENFIKRLDPQQAMQYQSEEGKKQILQELINQSLFLADAKTNELEKSDEFKNELAKMKDMILTQLNVNKLMQSIRFEQSDIQDHFKSNLKKFSTPEKADTSHILVDTEDECLDIQKKIAEGELTFEEAAKAHSKCPSKEKGGNLGLYPKGQMVPEFEAVAFNMGKGEISEPVKTQFGYHIIKLNEKQKAAEAKFDDVKETVTKDLISLKQREEYTKKITDMRDKYTIKML
ncbi:MAG: peptidylprolyl isomerase [Candidatus Cloacimonetes bacterium]|nr:peptidylprolyl isomerase [Candidatus Cloacimonadota bacterium]